MKCDVRTLMQKGEPKVIQSIVAQTQALSPDDSSDPKTHTHLTLVPGDGLCHVHGNAQFPEANSTARTGPSSCTQTRQRFGSYRRSRVQAHIEIHVTPACSASSDKPTKL